MLCLQTEAYKLFIANVSLSTTELEPHLRTYSCLYSVGAPDCQPSSKHEVRVLEQSTEVASCLFLGSGGATVIHEHSALLHESVCLVAVSDFVCALVLPSLQLQWQTQVDPITCFGVYHAPKHHCYLSHGETQIACLTYTGELVWAVGGKDIFTNGCQLYNDYVEVTDWEHAIYRIELASGHSRLVSN